MKGKIKSFLLLMVIFISAISCKQEIITESNANQHLLLAVLYQQKAAEAKALAFQAYNLAKLRLNEMLLNYDDSLEPAIVLDIDETILDNSPYEARCIVNQINYPEGWNEWVAEEKAASIPGSVEFIRYAKSKGVEVFYITNRKIENRESTYNNLKAYRLPFIDDDHVLMRESENSKTSRRAIVSENNRILLLIGDDLSDFSELFEEKEVKERMALTDSHQKEFGSKWIVIPNAMYGSWFDALIENKKDLSNEELVKLLISRLENL
ncbi:5'-nucleotidase, lipoprotein e(P4) family [Bacteroidota bacterium]